MDYVKERTHIIDHERFLSAGVHARDLWEWGMKYAGRHETDGIIPMAAVLASPWGYGGKKNIVAATKLVEVGLWERHDRGFVVCRWSEQGNLTKAQIDGEREAARARMKRRRLPTDHHTDESCSGDVRANIGRTSPDVPTSLSSSPAGRKDLPVREGESARGGPPEWFLDAIAMLEQNALDVHRGLGHIGERWMQYQGAIERGRPRTAIGAAGWLTSTIRSERADAERRKGQSRGSDITKQPYDPNAPWLKAASGDDQ